MISKLQVPGGYGEFEPRALNSPHEQADTVTVSQVSRTWLYGAIAMLGLGALLQSKPLFGLGLLLGVTIAVSWFWALWCFRNLSVQRHFSQSRAFWGEEVDMAQVFTNAKPLPLLWLNVEDEFPSVLEMQSSSVTLSEKARVKQLNTTVTLGWYERVTRRYKLKCTARGAHEFGPMRLQSGDAFGLFRRSETIKTPQELLVYPRYVSVEQLGIPARQPFGEFKSVQTLATDPLRIRGVREYVVGDSPRYIHWKATARRGELQTRLFEPSATPRLFIFCNQDTFASIWQGIDPQTLELTITVAASLANKALEDGYMVGLQVNAVVSSDKRNAEGAVRLPPSRDPGQFMRILESLARVKGWSGIPMEDLIRAQRRSLPIGATLVVVTGVVTDDMLDILLALRRAGNPITLVETVGSERAAGLARHRSEDALRTQGIVYYQVEAIGKVAELQSLSL